MDIYTISLLHNLNNYLSFLTFFLAALVVVFVLWTLSSLDEDEYKQWLREHYKLIALFMASPFITSGITVFIPSRSYMNVEHLTVLQNLLFFIQ